MTNKEIAQLILSEAIIIIGHEKDLNKTLDCIGKIKYITNKLYTINRDSLSEAEALYLEKSSEYISYSQKFAEYMLEYLNDRINDNSKIEIIVLTLNDIEHIYNFTISKNDLYSIENLLASIDLKNQILNNREIIKDYYDGHKIKS